MESIIIRSLRKGAVAVPPGYTPVRVDRRSMLGNPFVMHAENQRDTVCDQYEQWFQAKVENAGPVRDAVMDLYLRVISGEKIALMCWCHPNRCHSETIKQWVLSKV